MQRLKLSKKRESWDEHTFWGGHGQGDNDRADKNENGERTGVKKRCGMGANEGSIRWGRNREKGKDWAMGERELQPWTAHTNIMSPVLIPSTLSLV